MVATVPFNPNLTTNGLGSFNVSSTGLVQGTAFDDPSARFRLRGGWLSNSETIPMWGGVGIYENIPGVAGQPGNVLGPAVGRATTLTSGVAGSLAGFAVFDQNYSALITTSSPVPLTPSYGRVQYYPLGSKARIAVAVDPAIAALAGDPSSQAVSWDFVNQQLVDYASATAASQTYNNTTGAVVLTFSPSAPANVGVGDIVIVSGATGTAAASVNGEHVVTAVTGTTVTYVIASGLSAAVTGTIAIATGGILPCTILLLEIGNSMTVNYDGTNATWNRTGSAAIISI